jgi:hypothetical protein
MQILQVFAALLLLAVVSTFSLWLGYIIGAKDGVERAIRLLAEVDVTKARELAVIRIAEMTKQTEAVQAQNASALETARSIEEMRLRSRGAKDLTAN